MVHSNEAWRQGHLNPSDQAPAEAAALMQRVLYEVKLSPAARLSPHIEPRAGAVGAVGRARGRGEDAMGPEDLAEQAIGLPGMRNLKIDCRVGD